MTPVKLTDKQQDRAARLSFDVQTSKGANGFLGAVLLGLKRVYSTDIPTACVNLDTVVMNPEWMFDQLTPGQCVFVAYHEVLHLVYEHLLVRGNRDVRIWNAAADYRVNTDLVGMDLERPVEGLFDLTGKYAKMTTLEIYDDLIDSSTVVPEWGMEGDLVEPDPDATPEEKAKQVEVTAQVSDLIRNAAVVADSSEDGWGSLPGHLVASIKSEVSRKVSWREHLAHIPQKLKRSSVNYNKFSRRGIARGMYNPKREEKQLGTLGIAWDTSISVTEEQIALMKGECNSLRQMLNPEKMVIACFDTSIHKVHEVEPYQDLDLIQIQGRGGTSLFPVFDYFNKDPEKISCLIVFSDMECQAVTLAPSYPVYWVVLDNPSVRVNFGSIIHFNSYED